jgi:predicted dehydrogenase
MTMGLGIVGCGGHAVHHSHHLGDYFFAAAVWDPDPKAMEKISAVVQATKLEDLLSMPGVDAVMICSPDEFHLDQIEMALKAGKHVFCEKPLMIPEQDFNRLVAAFDLADIKELVLTTCHPRRFDRPFMWLKEKLQTVIVEESDFTVGNFGRSNEFINRFGKVLGFSFDFSYHEPSNAWKRKRSLLLDHLNHEVDLMNFLFGIRTFNGWKIHDAHDLYEVKGVRDDGISFDFRGSRRLPNEIYPEWCSVRFERGEVRLDMMLGLAEILDHEHKRKEIIGDLAIDYDGRLKRVMNDFGRHINGGIRGYLSREEMLMNTLAGIVLQKKGIQRVSVPR